MKIRRIHLVFALVFLVSVIIVVTRSDQQEQEATKPSSSGPVTAQQEQQIPVKKEAPVEQEKLEPVSLEAVIAEVAKIKAYAKEHGAEGQPAAVPLGREDPVELMATHLYNIDLTAKEMFEPERGYVLIELVSGTFNEELALREESSVAALVYFIRAVRLVSGWTEKFISTQVVIILLRYITEVRTLDWLTNRFGQTSSFVDLEALREPTLDRIYELADVEPAGPPRPR